jgi:hypothetical protein
MSASSRRRPAGIVRSAARSGRSPRGRGCIKIRSACSRWAIIKGGQTANCANVSVDNARRPADPRGVANRSWPGPPLQIGHSGVPATRRHMPPDGQRRDLACIRDVRTPWPPRGPAGAWQHKLPAMSRASPIAARRLRCRSGAEGTGMVGQAVGEVVGRSARGPLTVTAKDAAAAWSLLFMAQGGARCCSSCCSSLPPFSVVGWS